MIIVIKNCYHFRFDIEDCFIIAVNINVIFHVLYYFIFIQLFIYFAFLRNLKFVESFCYRNLLIIIISLLLLLSLIITFLQKILKLIYNSECFNDI